MEPRRSSDPPPDRLARLLADARGEDGRGGVRFEDGTSPEELVGGTGGEVLDGTPDAQVPWPPDAEVPGRGRHRQRGVPMLSVPASLRSADLAVGSRAVRGLLVLVVMTALVLGGRWVWAQRPAEALAGQRVEEAVGTGGTHGDAAGEAAAGGEEATGGAQGAGESGADAGAGQAGPAGAGQVAQGAPETAAAAEDLVVHVTGQVKDPGVVELPAGSRVVDAVRAAGGLTKEADQSSVNLARALVDGEQLWVGRPGEEPPAGWAPPPAAGGGGAGSGGSGGSAGSAGSAGSGAGIGGQVPPLDLNTATRADLEELPGVGPVTAGHILAWRDEHGRFSRVDELLEVSGIGERTLAQLEPLVTAGG